MRRRFPDLAWPAIPLVLLAAAAQASQPLPPRGANPERLMLPPDSPPAQTPPPAPVPDSLVDATRTDLLKRLGAAARDAKPELVVRESVVWPDGSLWCGKPGMRYTMALVPGWRLVWRAAGRDWAYHASRRGGFVYCEHPQPLGKRGAGEPTPDDRTRIVPPAK